jgi:hypothetical protein
MPVSARTWGSHAPVGVVVAHRPHRTADGQVQPHRSRIARCGSGENSGAAAGSPGWRRGPGLVLSDRTGPTAPCEPRSAAQPATARLRRPIRGPAPARAVPRSAPCSRDRRAAPAASGMEKAWKPRVRPGSGVVSVPGAPKPALGPCVSRIPGDRPSAERTDRPLAGPASGHTPPTARSQSWSDARLVGQAAAAIDFPPMKPTVA